MHWGLFSVTAAPQCLSPTRLPTAQASLPVQGLRWVWYDSAFISSFVNEQIYTFLVSLGFYKNQQAKNPSIDRVAYTTETHFSQLKQRQDQETASPVS